MSTRTLVVATLVVLASSGCRKKEAPTPPPTPPVAGPCGWESLEAWHPALGLVASRERLPESTTKETTEVVKEARPNCLPDEQLPICRERILKMVKAWVDADVTLELEPYEEPNAHRWRLDDLVPAGTTTRVGDKEMPNMDIRKGTELFDTDDACMARGRATKSPGRYSCSPAANFGFVFRATRKKTETLQFGKRVQFLWLYPKNSDPQAALAQLTQELEAAHFKLDRSSISNPGGFELDLTCP